MMKGYEIWNLLLLQNPENPYQLSQDVNPLGHLSFFKKEYFKGLNKRHLSESLTSVQFLLRLRLREAPGLGKEPEQILSLVQAMNKKLKGTFLDKFLRSSAAECKLKNFTFKHLLTNFNQKLESRRFLTNSGLFSAWSEWSDVRLNICS